MQRVCLTVARVLYYVLYGVFYIIDYLELLFHKVKARVLSSLLEQHKESQVRVKHLGIVRNDGNREETSVCLNLINLIFWCFSLGIDVITFVDSQVVDWNPWVERICAFWSIENFPNNNVDREASCFQKLTCTVENRNAGFRVILLSYRNRTVFTLNLLRSEDAHLSLIRGFFQLVNTKLEVYQTLPLSLRKTYMLDFLNSGADGSMIGSEPEVVVIFGNVPSLVGFPSWEVRLSQIFFQPSFPRFTFYDLREIIETHARTPKRFGK
ncbi:hypothetical protein GpartN1_g6051.t1 [Galdieria partita]|uniref:ditrans,polycis-polyprenyl diphosphate synthase [(2E,6E)-farnesyldiphosphate specific] n=1 Tax=Galdieria partita TaxID=83374 RepID=A0A9C7UTA1_9RHOD|nr:hypothetical protein GpartN1_g6051.t1 [Galdieria partita]